MRNSNVKFIQHSQIIVPIKKVMNIPRPTLVTKFFLCLLICGVTSLSLYSWPGYRLLYREQIYELYHKQLYMYPEHHAENIHWLEQTLRADFANPLNALAHIETKKEWEWYRNLFTMHINLLLLKNYLHWAKGYMKEHAYFFNAPWKEENIKSLEKAKVLVEFSSVYWDEVQKNVTDIQAMNLYFLNLEEIQNWEDEYYRIVNKQLDYGKIINRELQRIARVEQEFLAMDESTY